MDKLTRLETERSDNRALASVIKQRLSDAVTSRNSDTTHYPRGLSTEIELCHKARRGILDDDEVDVADELAHIGLEFGKRKALAAYDIISDLVRNSIDMPILAPTPTPELPKNVKLEIVEKMKQEMFQNQYSGDLRELASRLKVEATGTKMDRAKAAAIKAETALRDMFADMKYREVTRTIIDDFVSMPFAVAKFPHYSYEDDPKWVGNSWVLERKLKASVKRVDPDDFFVLNGTCVADAEAVFERDKTPAYQLRKLRDTHGWIKTAIDAVLEKAPTTGMTPTQMAVMLPSTRADISAPRFTSTDTKEIFWFYGRMQGEDITKIRSDASIRVEKDEYYEVCAVLCDEYVIYLDLLPVNSPKVRPYNVSSYEKLNGSWSGIGVLQRVRKAEKVARAFTYAAVRNAATSAQPTGEMEFERLREFYPDQDELNSFKAGHLYLTSADKTGLQGGRNAVTFHNIPNHSQSLLNGVTFFLDLVDLLAAVPKLGTGDMRGMATLGRSYRGIALVQQAEAKTIRAALDNFDQDLQEPILRSMYYTLQETSKDPSVRGDAQIIARSTSGYLRKEANAAARQETVQAMVGLANAKTEDGKPMVNSELMKSLILEMFRDQGIDVDRFYGADGLPTSGAQDEGNPVPTAPGFGGEQVPV